MKQIKVVYGTDDSCNKIHTLLTFTLLVILLATAWGFPERDKRAYYITLDG
jgi:hypothetical protein